MQSFAKQPALNRGKWQQENGLLDKNWWSDDIMYQLALLGYYNKNSV